jgi:Glucodextranase, domain B
MQMRRALVTGMLLCLPFALGVEDTSCAGRGANGQPNPVPDLTITSPADGLFTNDASVVVTGTARAGWTPIASLEVNGQSVLPLQGDPRDGTWSITLPLDPSKIFNDVFAEMTLEGGSVFRRRITVVAGDGVTTSYVNDGDYSPESIALRLNDRGLDQIEPSIQGLVDIDPGALLPPGTQVIDEYCYAHLFGACIGTADATIEANASPPSPSISSFDVNVDSQTNQARGLITLHDLFVRARVEDGSVGIGFTCHLNMSATTTSIDGNYALEPDAADPTRIDVTQLGGVAVSFGNFSRTTDCDGIFGFVVEAFLDLFVGNFESQMRDALQSFLDQVDPNGNTPLAAGIETALADVDIAGPIGDALGTTLETQLFEVAEDPDGITLGSDGAFLAEPVAGGTCHDASTGQELPGPVPCTSDLPCGEGEVCRAGVGQCVAPANHPDYAASYHVAEPFPALGADTPSSAPYGLGLCVSTSAFNQLLKAQLECGLLTQNVTEVPGLGTLTGSVLSLLVPEIAMFPLATEYELELEPKVSAIVTGSPGPNGELAELRVHALQVRLRDVAHQLPVLLTLSIDARLGLDASLQGGALSFQLGAPDPQSDVAVTFLVNRLGADEAALEDLIAGLFASAAPSLADALGAFPLPDFLGLQLSEVEVGRAGEFLSLYLDLQPAP